jgi:cytochrome c oxidase cbb3-type subunit IV
MTFESLLEHASSVMTLLSFLCFLGILVWAFSPGRSDDFDAAAMLPFADEESHHG